MTDQPPSDDSNGWTQPDVTPPPPSSPSFPPPPPGMPPPPPGAYGAPPPGGYGTAPPGPYGAPPPGGYGTPPPGGYGTPPPGAQQPGLYQPPPTPYPQTAGQPYGAYAAPGYVPPRQQATNGFAVASLVTGIIGCFYITPILAVIFGFVARKQIANSEGRQKGAGMALAGIILGGVWIVILGFVIVLAATGELDDEPVATRSEFVTTVSDAIEADDPGMYEGLDPDGRADASLALDDASSCLYDVYSEEPDMVGIILEDPLADEHRFPGITQRRVDELDARAGDCFATYEDRLTEIFSR